MNTTKLNKAMTVAGLLALVSGVAVARTDPVFNDGVPRVWTATAPTPSAQADARIAPIVNCTVWYKYVGSVAVGARSGIAFGDEIGRQAIGLGAGRIAVMLNHFGLGHSRRELPGGGIGRYDDPLDPMPALYNHPGDALNVGQPQNTYPAHWSELPTPWIREGASETSAWTYEFLLAYEARVGLGGPIINRVHMDQETDWIGRYEQGWSGLAAWTNDDLYRYWGCLKQNSRYNNAAYPIPGFGTKTLEQVWAEAQQSYGVQDPVIPAITSADQVRNSRWRAWWFGFKKQYEDAALSTSLGEVLYQAWGTDYSDYDGSIRVDGAAISGYNGLAPYNIPVRNAYYGGSFESFCEGGRVIWEGSGSLQSLCAYNSVSPYGIAGRAGDGSQWWTVNLRYSTTDDGVIYQNAYTSANPEDPEESTLRRLRFTADSMARSFGGVNKDKITAWTWLPNQYENVGGDGSYGPNKYKHWWTHRASGDIIRRTLAMLRARRVNELMVWNDVAYGAAGIYMTVNTAYNWDRLMAIIDQVWKMTTYAITPNGGSGQGTVADIRYAADTVYTQTMAGSEPAQATVQFRTQYAATLYYRISIEAMADKSGMVTAELRSPSSLNGEYSYVPFDLDPTGAATSAEFAAGKPIRVSGRAPAFGNPGALGRIYVRLTFTSPSNEGLQVKYDLVQLVSDDDVHRKVADFNADGAVNQADRDAYDLLYNAAVGSGGYEPMVEMNYDGFTTVADRDAFIAEHTACLGGNCQNAD